MHLRAEPAADIRRDDSQLMLGNADRIGDPAAMHMWHLALYVNCQDAADVGLSQNGASLHAGRDQAVVGNAKTNELIGFLRRLSVVAATYLVDRGKYVVQIIVYLRVAFSYSSFFV